MYRAFFLLFCKITKAQLQLTYKLSRSYMFRRYRVISVMRYFTLDTFNVLHILLI